MSKEKFSKEKMVSRFEASLEYNEVTILGEVKDILAEYPSRVIAEFTGLDENYIDRIRARREKLSDITLGDFCKIKSMKAVPDWYCPEMYKHKEYGPEVKEEDIKPSAKETPEENCEQPRNDKAENGNTGVFDVAKVYADAAEEAKIKLFGREMLPSTMTLEEMKKCLEENGWTDEFDFDGDETSDSMMLRAFLYRKLTEMTKEIYQAKKDKQKKKDNQPKHKDRSDDKSELAGIQELFDNLFGKGNVFFTKI